MQCPLCESFHFHEGSIDALGRQIFICDLCYLAYVDAKYHLTFEEQKKRYDRHENYETEGYVNFLNQCIQPTLPFLTKNNKICGLDYGSGPATFSKSEPYESVLAKILRRDYGIRTFCYDPIYSPILEITNLSFGHPFDFLFSTEVWEHFTEIKETIRHIHSLVKVGGIISVMTSPWKENTEFSEWYYARDETHVVFYHKKTMEWISEKFSWKLVARPIESVWIFQKYSE